MFLLLAGLSFNISGLMQAEAIQTGDVCQDVTDILDDQIPAHGKGTSYYFSCFKANTRLLLINQRFQVIDALNSAVLFYKYRL